MPECAHCGCAVEAHDPVYVSEGSPPVVAEADPYCNYACLSARIERDDLALGATCELDA